MPPVCGGRSPDAELAARLGFLEFPASDHLDHAEGQLAVAHALGGGSDDAAVGTDVEAGDELALERLPLQQARLVAVANVAGVVADVLADRPPLFAERGRRCGLVPRGLLVDHQRGHR